MAEERRTVMRSPVLIEARWTRLSGGTHYAHLKNLSVVGCFLENSVPLSAQPHLSEPIEVKIILPDRESVVIWGEVIFNLPEEGIGVYFTEVNEQVRESLIRFVEEYGRNEQAGEEAGDGEGAKKGGKK